MERDGEKMYAREGWKEMKRKWMQEKDGKIKRKWMQEKDGTR